MKKMMIVWRRFLLWIGAAALLVSVGCAKREAADELAMQLDMVQMVETAKESMETPASTDTINLYETLGAPERYAAELTSQSGKLRVHVDAPLTLPAYELPIVRVQKRMVTTEEVRHFAKVLMGEQPHYVENPYGTYTAAYCKKQAETVRAAIEDWSGQGNIRYDMIYNTVEEAQTGMQEWLKKAESAPESLPVFSPGFTWQRVQQWTEEGPVELNDAELVLTAMPDPATISELRAQNHMELDGYASIVYVRDRDKQIYSLWGSDNNIGAFVKLGESAAYETARKTADALGFSDFICVNSQRPLGDYRDWGAYGFVFTRCFSGIPETYTDVGFASSPHKPNWTYERLSMLIDDEGVLELWYDAPCDVLDTVATSTRLMPFSEIQSVFEKMVLLVNNNTEGNEMMEKIHLENDYYITDVRLGLMSVAEAEGTHTGLTVPVWDFLGYETYQSDVDSGTWHTARSHAFLTVNAIDGTVIDRAQGY